MPEDLIVTDPYYVRATWMLHNQINSVDDLIGFWKVFGLEV